MTAVTVNGREGEAFGPPEVRVIDVVNRILFSLNNGMGLHSWPGKGNQCKQGIDSSWIFIHDQIDSTMLTFMCRLSSAGAWVTLAHPKGGWANADAFIFNINLEQTQEQLQFFSMTLIRGKRICLNIWRQFFMFVLPLLPQLLLFLTSIPQLVFPCQACLWKMS